MTSFQRLPTHILNATTGAYTGNPNKISHRELRGQITDMANKKTPIKKGLSAIDKHPDIVDKDGAKKMAKSVYDSIESRKPKESQKS